MQNYSVTQIHIGYAISYLPVQIHIGFANLSAVVQNVALVQLLIYLYYTHNVARVQHFLHKKARCLSNVHLAWLWSGFGAVLERISSGFGAVFGMKSSLASYDLFALIAL